MILLNNSPYLLVDILELNNIHYFLKVENQTNGVRFMQWIAKAVKVFRRTPSIKSISIA